MLRIFNGTFTAAQPYGVQWTGTMAQVVPPGDVA
jgi:hypothetical protein